MVWQDTAIAIANFTFVYSLAYQVYHTFKKKKCTITLVTSSLTSIALFVTAVTFFSLDLFWSAFAASINTCLWATLFVQGLKYKN
jgi:hypothetical protein